MSKQTRTVRTAIHSPGVFICGMQPEPDEERVSLRSKHHAGFGVTRLLRSRKGRDPVMDEAWIDYDEMPTLQWCENRARKMPGWTWSLDVGGPMVSYTLTRRGRNRWVLTESRDGFT